MAEQNLKVAVIGAGMAGILAGIKLREAGYENVVIYEKSDRVGGTWRENTYPGLTCDVPSHHYTYTFERNPDWTRHLPPGPEVLAYFERTAQKYQLLETIRFGEEISRCEYRAGLWHLQMKSGLQDSANIVIAATGVLHHPSYPNISGLSDFQGSLFHSSRWDHSVPLEGKRIGVIGNGSTGVQIVSALADRAARLEHFQRTAQWIMPVENGFFSAEQRRAFREDPALLAEVMDVDAYNAAVERYTQGLTDTDSQGARQMGDACLQNLENSVLDPQLKEKLRPDHAPMCKRLIFSPDYYQAIQHPNANLVTEAIDCVAANGIITRDGELHELDIIVLATGFRADQFMRPMEIVGDKGVDLEQAWAKRPIAYLAISIPDFPNFFMLNGPNGPVGNFSLIDIAEHQWNFIAQLMEEVRSGKCSGISASHAAMHNFDTERVAAAKKTVWYTGGCNSWYLDAEGIPASWPWNYSRFVAEMTAPNMAHFDLISAENH